MTKTDFLKKLKAGLLAGTMAATLSACGHEPEKEKNTNETTIAVEDTTKETKTTKEETTKESKETATKEETTDNDTEIVENTTKENGESKTNNTTTKNNINNNTAQTNRVTTINHSSNTTKNNTTTVGTQRTQAPVNTKQQVTTKATTTTTKAVQTQAPTTTAAPVVTTTVPVKQNYTKYDMQDSNPEIAAKAFKQLSEELREELFNGYYVSDESYGMTAGYEQAKIILAALNYYNGNISPETLAHNDALGKLSREDMEKYCVNLDLPQEQYIYGSRVDFNKYVIDDDFADEIESITDKYFEWKDNGNSETIATSFEEYHKDNNYKHLENVDNFVKFYCMYTIIDEYEYTDNSEKDRETLREYLIIPMYESYEQYKEQSYSR